MFVYEFITIFVRIIKPTQTCSFLFENIPSRAAMSCGIL